MHAVFKEFGISSPMLSRLRQGTALQLDVCKLLLRSFLAEAADCSVWHYIYEWQMQKEQLVAFYMERALGAYPTCTPITGLSAGVDAAMRELPSGSTVVLYMFQCLAKRTSSLLQEGVSKQADTQAGLDLLRLLAQMLLVVEFRYLSDALNAVQGVVLDCCSVDTQTSCCSCIYEVLTSSDDYTRKIRCAHWYQGLVSKCGATAKQNALPGTEDLIHLLHGGGPLLQSH